MKPVKLTAKNWLTFKELEYTFEDRSLMIQGKNLTDEGQASNGSGKSAIQGAIEKCILNNTSRSTTDKELINYDEDEAYISLSIYCPIRKETLLIERKIHRSKGGSAQLSINNVEKYKFEDKMVSQIDSFILEWIRISTIDLQNNYIIAEDKFTSFFSSPNAKKVELIHRFSNASMVNGIENEVDVDIKEVNKKIEIVTASINEINGEIAANEKLLLKEQERDLKQEQQSQIDSLNVEIETLRDKKAFKSVLNYLGELFILSIEKEIEALQETLNSKQTVLEKLNVKSLNDRLSQIDKDRLKFNDTVKEKQELKEELNTSYDEIIELLNEANRNLAGIITCPKCKHEFLLSNDKVDIAKEKESVKELELLKNETDSEITNVTNEIQSIKTDKISPLNIEERQINENIAKINKQIREVNGEITNIKLSIECLNNEIKLKEGKLKIHLSVISSIDNEIVHIQNNIKEIQKQNTKTNPKVKEFETEIESLNQQKEVKQQELEKLQQELNEVTQWTYNFKKFKLHLAEKSIKLIQGYCNKYLSEMKSDLRIKIEGFKMKADKTIKEEITAYVIRDGEMRNFGNFSAGERGRMEYAMILALKAIIDSSNKWGGLQLLMTDECPSGLDSLGLSLIVKSLDVFQFPILITTHIQSESYLDNVLLVTKKNKVSTIN